MKDQRTDCYAEGLEAQEWPIARNGMLLTEIEDPGGIIIFILPPPPFKG